MITPLSNNLFPFLSLFLYLHSWISFITIKQGIFKLNKLQTISFLDTHTDRHNDRRKDKAITTRQYIYIYGVKLISLMYYQYLSIFFLHFFATHLRKKLLLETNGTHTVVNVNINNSFAK